MADTTLAGFTQQFRRRFELQALLFTIVLTMALVLVLFPIVLLVFYSFSIGPDEGPLRLGLDAWRNVLANPIYMDSLLNTVKILISVQVISYPVAIIVAWVLARTDLPGRHIFEFMFWMSFFMPTLAVLLGWIMCLDPEYGIFNKIATSLPFVTEGPFNIYSFWGIVWAHLVSHGITVKVMLLTPIFRNLDSSLEDASRICGANRLWTLMKIVLPVTMPAILAIMLMSMIRGMQTFEIEQVLGPPFQFYVYSTQVYTLIGQEPPDFASASVLGTIGLTLLIPIILLQRWVSTRRSYTTISRKMKIEPVRLGRGRIPALIGIGTVVFTLTILPLSFLGLSSMMKLFGFFDIPQPFTWDNWRTVLGDEAFRGAIVNTLMMSAGAVVLSIAFLSLVAYFSVRSSFRLRALLDFLSWLPSAVPGILFGLGLLYVFLEIPMFRALYGTIWLMILATTVSNMTFGTQVLKSNLLQLSRDLDEASRVSGATWFRTLRGVIMPIMIPSLLLVGTTSFITSARDIASVALVSTAGTRTLSLLQLDYMVQGRYGPAAVISFVVVLMSTGVALTARFLGLRVGMRG